MLIPEIPSPSVYAVDSVTSLMPGPLGMRESWATRTNMDMLSLIFDWYFDFAGDLRPAYFIGLMRAGFTFAFPTVLTAAAFRRGNRSVFIQVFCCVVGVLLAATIPVEAMEIQNRIVRGWIIALIVVILCFAPAALAFLLVPQAGPQRKVRMALYVLLGLLVMGILFHGVTNP